MSGLFDFSTSTFYYIVFQEQDPVKSEALRFALEDLGHTIENVYQMYWFGIFNDLCPYCKYPQALLDHKHCMVKTLIKGFSEFQLRFFLRRSYRKSCEDHYFYGVTRSIWKTLLWEEKTLRKVKSFVG